MKKHVFGLAAMMILTMALSVGTARAGTETGPTIQFGTRYETHSDKDNPDDYLYSFISLTGLLEEQLTASVYYIFKHNLDYEDTGGQAFGVNLIQRFTPKTVAVFGYSYTENEPSTTRAFSTDRDRLRLAVYRNIRSRAANRSLFAFSSINTQTDWSESQTLDVGLLYKYKFNERLLCDTSFKYTEALSDLDLHIYNQSSLDLSYKLNTRADLQIGYIFIDKTFTTPGGEPDDDNVFRVGVVYKNK